MLTFSDLIDHGLAYLGKDAARATAQDVRRAALNAYNHLADLHPWTFYTGRGRLNLNAAYSTGTVTYDHTGGASERLLTLASGTWPTWAEFGTVKIGDGLYEVASRLSNTTLQLAELSNPGDDVAAGTAYTLFRDTYPLPVDFVSCDDMVFLGRQLVVGQQHPRDWVRLNRLQQGPAEPRWFSITGEPNYFGTMCARFWPAPDQSYAVDFLYRRRGRAILTDRYETGKVSVSDGSAVVTGSGATFTARMKGAVLRLGTTTDSPTGAGGLKPFVQERVVLSYTDSSTLVADAEFDQTQAGVRYVVSDPVDVEAAMQDLLYREVERQIRLAVRMAGTPEERDAYDRAVMEAREADSRYTGRRATLRDKRVYDGLHTMPVSFAGDG